MVVDSKDLNECLIESNGYGDAEIQENEPESITKWRSEFKEKISQRDDLEKEKMSKMETEAAQQLNEWHAKYEQSLSSALKNNLDHDAELKKAQESNIAVSNSMAKVDASQSEIWERICNLCDFTSQTSTKQNTREDLQRMRSLLLNLKSNPIEKMC